MNMFIPFFSEKTSPLEKVSEIHAVLLLLQKQMRQQNPAVTLSASEWSYILLPGRLDEEQWQPVLSSKYHCLYHSDNSPFAIIIHVEDAFYPVITDVLTIQNDFVYFIAFAAPRYSGTHQFLIWINMLLKNEQIHQLPPYTILTFESGCLLL